MMQQHAALFDLDGVILDTENQYSHFWSEQGKIYFPNNPNFSDSIKGNTLTAIFRDHFTCPTQQAEVEKALIAFEAQMEYPFIAGAMAFVDSLRKVGIPTAVVTSSNRTKMEAVYAKCPELKHLFDRIFTAEDVTVGKPAPDCYLNAAHFFELDIKDCVVFEDSINGLKSASSSGAKVVGLTTTNHKEVVIPYSDYIIPDFTHFSIQQLLELFQ